MRAFPTSMKSLVSLTIITLSFVAPVALSAPFQDGGAIPFKSDLLGWFDASSDNSLYTDIACTTAASNSGAVACWKDISGKAHHLAALKTETAPSVSEDGPVNRKVVNFSAAKLQTLENSLAASTDYSLFVVMKPTSVKENNPLFSSADNASNPRSFEISTSATQMLFKNGRNGFGYAAQERKWHIDAFSHITNGAETLNAWRDDTSLSPRNLSGQKSQPAAVFTHLRLNRDLSGAHYGDYQVAELVIYNRALTDCESREVSFFLAKKYNFNFINIDKYGFYSQYGYDLAALTNLKHVTADPSTACSNLFVTTSSSDIVTLSAPSDLGQDEVIFFGHNGEALASDNSTDFPSKLGGSRLARVWTVDYKTEATEQTVDVTFKVAGSSVETASNYALLVASSAEASFSGAAVVFPNKLENGVLTFSRVKLSNNAVFTLAKNIISDIDGDGVANNQECLDSAICAVADSDSDGIPDYLESDKIDTDSDGVTNNLDVDDDGDGISTKNEIATQLNLIATALNPADTDQDRIPDYLDSDDDGDGISTKNEVGANSSSPLDINGDGTSDYLQSTVDGSRGLGGTGSQTVKTGKGGSIQAVSLLFLFGLLIVRRRSKIAKNMRWSLMPLALVAGSSQVLATDEPISAAPFFFGGDVGFSYLKPDVDGTDFKRDGSGDIGFGLFAGYHLLPSVDLQFNYDYLGKAKLSNTTDQKKGSIDYQTWSIDARKTFWQYGDRWSAFAGAGFNYLQNSSSTINYEKQSSIQIKLLAGADYAMLPGLYLRSQVERFAGDASYFSVGIVKYLESYPSDRVTQEEIVSPPVVKEEEKRVDIITAPVKSKEVVTLDSDKDGILDSFDQCPDTAVDLRIDDKGCAVFDYSFPNIIFNTNSSRLMQDSLAVLNNLVIEINRFSSTRRIEVQAYTDNIGENGYNLWLSQRRAQSIADYLVAHGVSVERLTVKGYGSENPVADNSTEEGRSKNRRAVFKVLN